MTYDQIAIRKALVDAGLRTFAYGFDGSGDSGSLEEMLFPVGPSLSLSYYEDESLEGTFTGVRYYGKDANGTWGMIENEGAIAARNIILSIDGAESVMHDLAYSALEHFDGDWVNNDGGYGIVAMDLLTGEFRIDGYQRYSDTSSANSSGTFLEAIDEPSLTTLDLTKHLKSTLNVS